MPKQFYSQEKINQVFENPEVNTQIEKALKKAGHESNASSIMSKAKEEIRKTESSRDFMKSIEALDKRLKNLKTSSDKLVGVMPNKWTILQYLKKIKELFAGDRNKIMDQMEDEFRRIIEEKFSHVKVDKPLNNPEKWKVKKPVAEEVSEKEYIKHMAKHGLG